MNTKPPHARGAFFVLSHLLPRQLLEEFERFRAHLRLDRTFTRRHGAKGWDGVAQTVGRRACMDGGRMESVMIDNVMMDSVMIETVMMDAVMMAVGEMDASRMWAGRVGAGDARARAAGRLARGRGIKCARRMGCAWDAPGMGRFWGMRMCWRGRCARGWGGDLRTKRGSNRFDSSYILYRNMPAILPRTLCRRFRSERGKAPAASPAPSGLCPWALWQAPWLPVC